MSTIGWTAFNFLPYRPGARRRARARALAVIAGAGLAGCAGVGLVAAWDGWERAGIEQTRGVHELALQKLRAPMAEYARLAEEEASRLRAGRIAKPLAEPRERFLSLLDALAGALSSSAIGLQRVTQRAQEVELAASAPDSHAAALWLKSLEHVAGVRAVEIVDMRRQVLPASNKAGKGGVGAYDFIAVVRWAQTADTRPTAKVVKASGSKQ